MAVKLWETGTQNAFSTTLDGTVNPADSSIVLTSVTGLVAPGIVVIDRLDADDNSTPTLREYVSYTGISTKTLTGVTRGLAGSSDQAHNSGALVEEVFSVTHWGDLLDFLAVSLNTTTGKLNPEAWATVSFADPISIDVSAAKKHKVTLADSGYTVSFDNTAADDVFIVKLVQDAVGGRTVIWGDDISWPDNTEPTLTTTASHWDIFGFIRTGSGTYDGVILGQNFEAQ